MFVLFHGVASRDASSFVVAGGAVTGGGRGTVAEALAELGCHVSRLEADLVLGQQQAGDVVGLEVVACGPPRGVKKKNGRSANDSCQHKSHD